MLSVFCSPSRYTQGRNATAGLGAEMTALGLEGPALIVAGSSAVAKLADVWRDGLGKAGIAYTVHRFGGECSHAEIARVEQAGHAQRASRRRRRRRREGARHRARRGGRSRGARGQLPAAGLERLLVAGMGDALATWFEAKTCVDGRIKNMRGGASTRSAAALARLCYDTLLADGAAAVRAVETRVVTPALERLVEANTLLSGLGFESSGLAAAHAVHNGLTTAPGTHPFFHGEKVAFGTLVQLVLEGQSRETFAEVLGFATEVGLPITLAEIGLAELSREMLARIAARVTAVLATDATGRAWRRDRPRPSLP